MEAPVGLCCPTCNVNMRDENGVYVDVTAVDWEQVHMGNRVKQMELDLERKLTEKERQQVANTTGRDPCDDCCCGSCGQRKELRGKGGTRRMECC